LGHEVAQDVDGEDGGVDGAAEEDGTEDDDVEVDLVAAEQNILSSFCWLGFLLGAGLPTSLWGSLCATELLASSAR